MARTRARSRLFAKYTSEAELCDELADVARAHGFLVYPETGENDLLLVAGESVPGFKPGDQIGVQAKLFANAAVLYQALPRGPTQQGPHYYATLTPAPDRTFQELASRLRITTLFGSALHGGREFSFRRYTWHRHHPFKPCWVPACEVEGLRGGMKGPTQLTEWKQSAIQLCVLGEDRGYLLGRDFKEKGVSIGRWLTNGWIRAGEVVLEGGKRVKRYYIVRENNPPHIKHATVTAAMRKAGLV
jgi:hypothetical protein